jgi:hypothetical protein
MITEELKQRIGTVKSAARRLNIDLDESQRVLDLAAKLSPLEVKTDMYSPMMRFQEPLDYDTASQNVALRQLSATKHISYSQN